MYFVFFFQAEDGIRDLVRSRGLGDVYKRQIFILKRQIRTRGPIQGKIHLYLVFFQPLGQGLNSLFFCLLYTSDAADERSSVDLGGRRIIKKQKKIEKK